MTTRRLSTNLFALPDAARAWLTGLRNKAAIKVGRTPTKFVPSSVSNDVLSRARAAYDNIAGRFDSPQYVPSRYLERVAPEDEEMLEALGVERDEQGRWVVPEDQDLADYEQWWPKTPADLLDKTPRLITTKNGKSIHAYVLPEDRAKGADSTATVLMYAAFPLVAAATYALSKVMGPLAYLLLLALIPYVVSLSQSEGPKDAIRSLVLLAIGPLFMATGGVASPFSSLPGGGVPASPLGMAGTMGGGLLMLLVFAFVATLVIGDKSKGAFSGTFEMFKAFVKWGVFIGVAYMACQYLLPDFLQPAFWFGLACLWPMKYTNDNAVVRAGFEFAHFLENNLESMGSLTNVAQQPKIAQARRAYEDKSPLIEFGTATGWLTRKQYDYAPDEGTVMCLSANDLATHMLILGATGSGKTESIMRGTAVQWKARRAGGFYCVDGKGALPGELEPLFDIVVRTGVDFAPLEGLDGHGVYLALVGLGGGHNIKESENRVWISGANTVIDHLTTLHWALHTHEIQYKSYAAKAAGSLELEIDELELEAIRLKKLGKDAASTQARIERLRSDLADWVEVRDKPRKWLWNVNTLMKILTMVEAVDDRSRRPNHELVEAAVSLLGYGAAENDPLRVATAPQTIHPDIGKQSVLDGSLHYLLVNWPNIDERQRSSFLINVQDRLQPLTRGPGLVNSKGVHWSVLEHGVDVSKCLYGASVGLDLPSSEHGEAGVYVAAFANQRVYSGLKKRAKKGGNWADDGSTSVMIMFDEAQLLVGEQEAELMPIARSLGGRFVMATQGFESLEVQFADEVAAIKFCNTFQSLACLQASPQTYAYMVMRLGSAQLVSFKQKTVGLDVEAAVRKLADSPLNDVDHPDRAIMRKFLRKGAGRMTVLSGNRGAYAGGPEMSGRFIGHASYAIDEREVAQRIIIPRGGVKQIQPVLKEEEFDALCFMGQGVLLLNRAGVRRVDVVQWHPVKARDVEAKLAELQDAAT